MTWDWSLTRRILPTLMEGLVTTVWITLLAAGIAISLGLFLALLRRSSRRVLSWPAASIIEFIRSTPVLVQLYFGFYVLPTLGLTLSANVAGVCILGLHYATYTSEVYRAGIANVARGQWEAARALNLPMVSTWTRVVLPQAIPPMIPALGNYVNAMFKATPILLAITVVELLARANAIGDETFRYLEPITIAGVLFFAVSYPMSFATRRLERRFGSV